MPVSKKELVKTIPYKTKLSQKDSLFVLEAFIAFIKKNHTKKINIHGFGTFSMKETPSRIGRNPKTKKEHVIKARKKLVFKPSAEVKKRIN